MSPLSRVFVLFSAISPRFFTLSENPWNPEIETEDYPPPSVFKKLDLVPSYCVRDFY